MHNVFIVFLLHVAYRRIIVTNTITRNSYSFPACSLCIFRTICSHCFGVRNVRFTGEDLPLSSFPSLCNISSLALFREWLGFHFTFVLLSCFWHNRAIKDDYSCKTNVWASKRRERQRRGWSECAVKAVLQSRSSRSHQDQVQVSRLNMNGAEV